MPTRTPANIGRCVLRAAVLFLLCIPPGLAQTGGDITFTIVHTPIRAADPNKSIPVHATISDPRKVTYASVNYRKKGGGAFRTVFMTHTMSNNFIATIPAADVVPPAIEYYIFVMDIHGVPHVIFGNPRLPQPVEVTPAAAMPHAQPAAVRVEEEMARTEEFLFGAEPVVTSAARREQPLHEAPFAVTVFTPEDIRLFGIHSLGDILRLVPGMDVANVTPGFTYYNVRGFATESNVRTLVLLDGRIMNVDAIGSTLIEIFPISIDEIERIEVIRGGGSSLYGANAYSGVISIFTRNPEKTPLAWGHISGGAQPDEIRSKPLGTSSASAGSGWWRPGLGGYRASAGYRQSNDWLNPDDINHRVTWGRLFLGTDAIPGLRLGVEGGGEEIKTLLWGSIANVPVKAREYFAQVKGEYEGLTVNGYYKYVHDDASFTGNLGGILTLSLPVTGNTQSVTGDIQYSWHISRYFHFIPGANVRYMTYDIAGFRREWKGVALDKEVMVGGFTHLEMTPRPYLSAVLDLRYDWFSITKPAFSPRLSILGTIAEGHILRAAAGESFRKPTWLQAQAVSQDRILTGIFRSPVFGNPDVGNERVRSVELGYRGYLRKNLRVEADVFYNQYTDFILNQASLTARTLRSENIHVLLWGVGGEAAVEYNPLPWISAGANYSFIYKKEYLTGVTETTTQQKAAVSMKIMPPRLPYLGLMAQSVQAFTYEIYNLSTLINEIQTIPTYVLVNGTLGYKFLNDQMEAGLFVFNIFNHIHYETVHLGGTQPTGAEPLGQKILLYLRAGL